MSAAEFVLFCAFIVLYSVLVIHLTNKTEQFYSLECGLY